jgi:hypothetical protein
MPERAARLSAGQQATATRTRDGSPRRAGDFRPARDRSQAARGERRLSPARDFSGGSELRGFDPPPRRTVVIRGQVADRYSSPRSSRPFGVSGSRGPLRMRPERAALWAVLLGFALVVAALASAHM